MPLDLKTIAFSTGVLREQHYTLGNVCPDTMRVLKPRTLPHIPPTIPVYVSKIVINRASVHEQILADQALPLQHRHRIPTHQSHVKSGVLQLEPRPRFCLPAPSLRHSKTRHSLKGAWPGIALAAFALAQQSSLYTTPTISSVPPPGEESQRSLPR